MTLYDVFNENLERIPKIALDAEKTIAVYGWPEMRKKHASKILSQLYGGRPLITEKCNRVGINLTRLELKLCTAECGIEGSDTFDEQNVHKATQYVDGLVADLNKVVKDIVFYNEGHYPKNTTCTYTIAWKF